MSNKPVCGSTRDYILSGETGLIADIVDTSHLEHNLYLTTQLLEMKVPMVVVLNIMEEARGRAAQFDIETLRRRLGCPVMAAVATRRREVETLQEDLLQLARERPRPEFTLAYPPPVEKAVSVLEETIGQAAEPNRFDERWMAVRLLEGDAFAHGQAGAETREVLDRELRHIAVEGAEETDILIAGSRYKFIHDLAADVLPGRGGSGSAVSEGLDRVVLNRFLGIPIFLGIHVLPVLVHHSARAGIQAIFQSGFQRPFRGGPRLAARRDRRARVAENSSGGRRR